jgi:hypothetical protein
MNSQSLASRSESDGSGSWPDGVPPEELLGEFGDSSIETTLQATADLRTHLEILHLLHRQYRDQMRRLRGELVQSRAACAQLQRELDRQRQENQQLRVEVQRQDATAPECARRPEGLPSRRATGTAVHDDASAESETVRDPGARGASPAAPLLRETPTAGGPERAEVVFLRVPTTRQAGALHGAVSALPGVTSCRLREFECGRLVLDVDHGLGSRLVDRLRGLPEFDLRLVRARGDHLELQML